MLKALLRYPGNLWMGYHLITHTLRKFLDLKRLTLDEEKWHSFVGVAYTFPKQPFLFLHFILQKDHLLRCSTKHY